MVEHSIDCLERLGSSAVIMRLRHAGWGGAQTFNSIVCTYVPVRIARASIVLQSQV
jgi:hypothetical protein